MTPDDRRWLVGAENWGEWYTHPQFLPAGRELVYMMRGRNNTVRFYAPGPALGGSGVRQVGPELRSVVAATYWAYRHQWVDPHMTDAQNRWATTEVWSNSGGGARPHELESAR